MQRKWDKKRNRAKTQSLKAARASFKTGNPPITYRYPYATARRYVINAVDDDVTTRSLIFMSPLQVPKATAVTDLNARTRDIIDLTGIKVTFRAVANASAPEEGGSIQYRMVVVQQKNSDAVATSDFFRGDGSGDRGIDFSDARNSMEFQHLPLNADVYDVLAERKGILQPWDKLVRDEKFWVPCNKRIHYDSGGSPILPIRVFYWFDVPNGIGGDAGLTSVNWKRMVRTETFFHNIP
jgi:hypothetical protein